MKDGRLAVVLDSASTQHYTHQDHMFRKVVIKGVVVGVVCYRLSYYQGPEDTVTPVEACKKVVSISLLLSPPDGS